MLVCLLTPIFLFFFSAIGFSFPFVPQKPQKKKRKILNFKKIKKSYQAWFIRFRVYPKPKTGLWVLGFEAGINKTGTRLSSPYQTGTGFIRYFTQEGEGTSLGANSLSLSLSLSLFPG
jgi:hypothetical protein